MNANQEAALLACAAFDSKREGDGHNEDSSEEESEPEDEDRTRAGPAAFNVLTDW